MRRLAGRLSSGRDWKVPRNVRRFPHFQSVFFWQDNAFTPKVASMWCTRIILCEGHAVPRISHISLVLGT